MTLLELLNKANEGYPDEGLREGDDPNTGTVKDRAGRAGIGDTLAEFIVVELSETFDPDLSDGVQLTEAHRVLDNAISELEGVLRALAE